MEHQVGRASGGPRRGARTVGRLAGAPLDVAPSAVLMVVGAAAFAYLALLTRVAAPRSQLVAAALVTAVLVAASVVAHELAHALAARRVGVAVERVTITGWGARVVLDDRALTPGATAAVAAVGPVTNLALGGVAWLASAAAPAQGPAWWALALVAGVNALLGGSNLLPATPLDGGRVLAAAVWRATGDRHRGAVVAAWAGRALAVLVLLVLVVRPLADGGRTALPLVALAVAGAALLWVAAGTGLRSARAARRVDALDLRRLATPALALPDDDTVADLVAVTAVAGTAVAGTAVAGTAVPGTALPVVLVDAARGPVARVDAAAVAAVPPERRAATPLAAVALPIPPGCTVDVRLAGRDALRAVAAGAGRSPVLVLVDGDEVLGLLDARDVVAALRG